MSVSIGLFGVIHRIGRWINIPEKLLDNPGGEFRWRLIRHFLLVHLDKNPERSGFFKIIHVEKRGISPGGEQNLRTEDFLR